MRKILLASFLLLFIQNIFAQCNPPTASTFLDINNISAQILNGGDMWWDGLNSAHYEYPKGSGKNLFFNKAIWLSGKDNQDNLRLAAMTYRNQGHDFYAGPLGMNQTILNPFTCPVFDKIFEVTKLQIDQHVNLVQQGTFPINSNLIPNNIKHWPAIGNAYFANLNYPITEKLAPFVDYNGNGIYDPENGDFPHIKGDKALFWVINDVGTHNYSGGSRLNVQINCMAYAYNNPNNHLNNTTFYDYEVVKKTFGDYNDFYFSLYLDVELGTYTDDYVGCDSTHNLAFVYNANAVDGIYGANPPVAVVKMVESSQGVKMSSFCYIGSLGCSMMPSNPNAAELRNYQIGLDRCGNNFVEGGPGVAGTPCATNTPTKYLYSGNPADCLQWSECSPSIDTCLCSPIAPADRRMLMSFGPFTLNYNNPAKLSFAVTALETENYTGCVNTETFLVPQMLLLQTQYTNNLKMGNFYNIEIPTSIKNLQNSSLVVSPNPANNYFTIDGIDIATISSIEIYNIEGKLLQSIVQPSKLISTENLTNGTYFIKINSATSFTIKKLLVLK
jgi:hypothetical protein